jgi:Skp family chaperone for outer membrane proteins
LLEDINKVITDKVKAAGYDLVIDKSGQSLNAVGVLVYSKDSLDFTADIIAEINKAAGKDAAKPAKK